MSGCQACAAISAATEPHVLWGALALVGLTLWLVLCKPGKTLLPLLLIMLIGMGIAVDVAAHDYQH